MSHNNHPWDEDNNQQQRNAYKKSIFEMKTSRGYNLGNYIVFVVIAVVLAIVVAVWRARSVRVESRMTIEQLSNDSGTTKDVWQHPAPSDHRSQDVAPSNSPERPEQVPGAAVDDGGDELQRLLDEVHRNRGGSETDDAVMTDFFEYGCMDSYIASDPGYGKVEVGCPAGTAEMEMTDHLGTILEAMDDCSERGLRLPSYHELSAAARFKDQLKLQNADYWANSPKPEEKTRNCHMGRGNCGSYRDHIPTIPKLYRCVK